ncbi:MULTISPECIES: TIR domain-containing protein [unclassified Candidatus Paralachnospira]|uniref:TIR domain-containing protein n=1 Tax=unclassified Candidatus Paralachnospira TaxID=3099471 RepID=UPI003F8E42D7
MRRCSVKPYEGQEAYIFISYCHKDRASVFPIIEQMARDGYRVWYDEGIDPGSEWPEIIASHLNGSAACVAFITENAVNSHNCKREINFALLKKKPFISVILEPVQMSMGMEMQLAATQAIFKYTLESEKEFYKKLYAARMLESSMGLPDAQIEVSRPEDYETEEESLFEETREPRDSFSDKWFRSEPETADANTDSQAKETEHQMERKLKAAEEARCQAEAARREAEEKLKAAEEKHRQAEEEAKRQAEQKAAEEARRREAEAKRQAEEAAQRQAEQKAAEEAHRREAEAKRQAEEAARREAEAKRQAEEAARREAEAKRLAEPERHQTPEKKEKRGIWLIPIVLIAVIYVCLNGIPKLFFGGKMEISGQKVEKDAENLYLSNKMLTAKDMKALSSMKKLEAVYLTDCTLDDEAAAAIGTNAEGLRILCMENCTGVENYQFLSALEKLENLRIKNCGLTDSQFSAIDLSRLSELDTVDLSGNADLTNLSNLTNLAGSLYRLNVSQTGVSDFTPLSDCTSLEYLTANELGLGSLENLVGAVPSLSDLAAEQNEITDLSPLYALPGLRGLDVSGNQITDLAPLSGMEELVNLKADDNQLTSLEALVSCKSLQTISVSRNQLETLSGLEQALRLTSLKADENKIFELNGIENCTLLSTVSIDGNAVADLSVLAKSREKLTYLSFRDNLVTDLSPLTDMSSLKKLKFDRNYVEDLSPLKTMTALELISADENGISSIEEICYSRHLRDMSFADNQITDMQPLVDLGIQAERDFDVVDLSGNQISELKLPGAQKVEYLNLCGNPLTSFAASSSKRGWEIYFDYAAGADMESLEKLFTFYNVVDCPLDEQVMWEKTLSGIRFMTAEEAKADMESWKVSSGF